MERADKDKIIERLQKIRIDFAGNRGKAKFARLLGVSSSAYGSYEKDTLAPLGVLLKVCEIAEVSVEWLLTGRFDSQTANIAKYPQLLKKIDSIAAKSPVTVGALDAFADILQDKIEMEKVQPSEESENKWIPVLGTTAAGVADSWEQKILAGSANFKDEIYDMVKRYAGKSVCNTISGKMNVDVNLRGFLKSLAGKRANLVQIKKPKSNQVMQFVENGAIKRKFTDSFALAVDGDSMSPRINDSDIVILSRSAAAMDGHPAVVRLAGEPTTTCKIFKFVGEKVHLIPINEKFRTKIVDKENIEWALAVLCHIKTD